MLLASASAALGQARPSSTEVPDNVVGANVTGAILRVAVAVADADAPTDAPLSPAVQNGRPIPAEELDAARAWVKARATQLNALDRAAFNGTPPNWGEARPAPLVTAPSDRNLLAATGGLTRLALVDGQLALVDGDAVRAFRRAWAALWLTDASADELDGNVRQTARLLEPAALDLARVAVGRAADATPRREFDALKAALADPAPVHRRWLAHLAAEGALAAQVADVPPQPNSAGGRTLVMMDTVLVALVEQRHPAAVVAEARRLIDVQAQLTPTPEKLNAADASAARAALVVKPFTADVNNAAAARVVEQELTAALHAHLELLARRQLTAIALATAQYRLDHAGAAPARVEDLVPKYLPAWPADPCGLARVPLRFAAEPTPRAWSVARDGKDDGGELPDPSAVTARVRDVVISLAAER